MPKSAHIVPSAATGRHAAATGKKSNLYPLDFAYTRAGVAPPAVKTVLPEEILPPYRSLLVHESDMTLTLEHHFGGRMVLRTLSTFRIGHWYFRRVLLVQEYSGRPVEMGAIRMRLDAFHPRIRNEILRNKTPLGRVLRDGGVNFKSQPRTFMAVTPNSEMMGVFWMREPRTLYGRQTTVMEHGAKLGDIVEVLPLV